MSFIPNEGDAPLDGEQTELDSVDLTIILDGFRLRGVKSGCAVTAGPGALESTVAAGVISFDDGVSIVVAGGALTHAAAGPHTRFDLVVADSAGALSIVDGTAEWSTIYGPSFPTYTDKVVLAVVTVLTSTTTIATANIIDKRVMLKFPASSIFGLDHGNLAGLADDDHPQYTTAAEADAIAVIEVAVHVALSDPHTQYTREDVLTSTGDLYYASAASTPARLGVSPPVANVRAVLGLDNGDTIPAWKTALDGTLPVTITAGGAGAAGTSLVFAHRDHDHPAPATWPAAAHVILDSTYHSDTLTGSVLDGDTIIGNVTPKWSRLAISVPAANVLNVFAVANGETRPSWKAVLDGTTPAAISTAGSAGTSLITAHRDHVHAHEAAHLAHDTLWDAAGDLVLGSGADTAVKLSITVPGANILEVLGVVNGETTASWKPVHDATAPTTMAPSDVAAAGTSLFSSHRDHLHGAPATWPATAHNIFSAKHGDTTGAASPVDGDIVIGNVTPAWSKLAITVPAANVLNVLAVANGETRPSWKSVLDGTNPADIANAASPGTSLITAHRDHVHNFPNLSVATYLRLGSTSAPTNITSGDFTAVRVKVGNGAFGTGVEFSVTGDGALSGFLRVGSETAPANTTAGDLTTIRFNIGNNVFTYADGLIEAIKASYAPAASNNVFHFAATVGDAGSNFTTNAVYGGLTLVPTAADSGGHAAMSYLAEHLTGNFNLTGATGLYGVQGQVTQNIAVVSNAGAFRGALVVSGGDVTNLYGIDIRSTLTGGGTITSLSYYSILVNSLPTAITTHSGLNIPNLGGAGVTNAVAIDIAAQSGAATLNLGIRCLAAAIFSTTLIVGANAAITAGFEFEVRGATGGILVGDATPGDNFALLKFNISRAWQFETDGVDGAGQKLALTALVDAKNFNIQSVGGTKIFEVIATNAGGSFGLFGVTPATRQTYAASNVTTDRTYDANATTTDELADVLGTLINDLRSFGLVL